MAEDIFKPTGALKSSKTDAGGGVTRPEAVLGVVKSNIDPIRAGRIQVYIQDIGANDPDDSSNWVTVSYLSPFFGMTTPAGGQNGYGTYLENPASYGVWNSAPDIGTTVVCLFINGDMNYGYYIGCVPTPETLQMIPAIGATTNIIPNEGEAQSYGGATRLPVTNINTNNTQQAEGNGFITEPKPVHSYAASIYNQQGLLRDPIRGPISSSAQRETPSRVGYGVSTPGRPIYEGGYDDASIADAIAGSDTGSLKVVGRRSGHTFVMDDGDIVGRDQLIRLRTSLGHQILMSDDGQCLHIMHSNGQSWIELGKEGTIDMYSTNSVNIRTQGDLNLHADNNININAAKNLNIAAGENIVMTSEKDMKFKAGVNFNHYAVGKYTVKVDGAMSMASAGEASYASQNATYINGSKVNLNTGSSGTVPATVSPIPIVAHTDTLYDATKGYAAAPGKLLTIVSRAPAHAPWANAGQGVDVKTTTSASAALPSAPSAAVSAANKAAPVNPPTPVTTSVAATVPDQGAVSKALDKNTTATMVGAVSRNAALGPAAAAVKAGTGVVDTAAGKVASIGALALTPQQLESAGAIKPGSATLVNSLVAGGKTVEQALTPNLFTGKPGAENLATIATSIPAQVKTTVANLQNSQAALTKAGVITGKEAPGSIAGLVMSGATAGIKATTDFIKNAASSVTNTINNITNSVNSAVSSAISSGNFAANLSQNVTGGLGSIAGALSKAGSGLSSLLDSAKGVAGSAFAAVTSAFKPMKAGVPQDLTALAKKNAADAEKTSASGGLLSSITSGVTGAIGSVTGSLNSAIGSVTSSLNSTIGSVTGSLTGASSPGSLLGSVTGSISSAVKTVTGTVNSITGMATKAIASVTSGLSGIPGGANTISNIVSKGPGATNAVPGLGPVTALIKNTSTAVTNVIGSAQAAVGGALSAASNLAGSATNALNSLTGLSSTGGLNSMLAGGLDKLKSGANSLANLATAGLPAGAAAQLNSAINSLSAGGPIPIKLPTVATDTLDRSEIKAQTASLLGDPKIPAPNFSPGAVDASLAKIQDLEAQADALLKEKDAADQKYATAFNAYYSAKDSLPQGDPQLETLQAASNAALEEVNAIGKKISALAATAQA